MHIRVPKIVSQATSAMGRRQRSRNFHGDHHHPESAGVPKGHLPVYIGESDEEKKNRVVVPIAYLEHPSFQVLLRKAEEEFGFHPPTGGLTLPCSHDHFLHLTSHLTGRR